MATMSPIAPSCNCWHCGPHGGVVAVTEARDDGEPFFVSLPACLDHGPDTRCVDRHRLFGKNMLSRSNRRLELGRTKMRRSAQQHDVAQFDHVLVSVDSDESPIRRNLHSRVASIVVEHALEAMQALFEPIAECIRHRDEMDIRPGGKSLERGPGSPPTASDQSDFDRTVAPGVDRRVQADLSQDRTADDCGSRLEKVAPRGGKGARGGGVGHRELLRFVL